MQALKIVFMGTPDFATLQLEAIQKSPHKIVGVVTVEDKPAGRGRKLQASSVKLAAQKFDLPIFQPSNLKDPSFIENLKKLQADVFVVVAFRMLPKVVWEIPPKGTFNLHASLLPQYRGAAPIHWAILNGETKTGVTTFLIDQHIDTGKILLQKEISIGKSQTTGELHDDLAKIGQEIILETLNGLALNTLIAKDQTAEGELKTAPKLYKETGFLNFDVPGEVIFNQIRGLNPYPSAHTIFQLDGVKKNFKIHKATFIKGEKRRKIKELFIENELLCLQLADGILEITELQMEGKTRILAKEFVRGYQNTFFSL
ncbi:MAG: methionyl-tRNA formyltransferase [Flavobacteriaceae bacterium]|nr:MAG: methionyl-tRNA formyltransferase [Flavobacteriaceae bacterium]